MVFIFYDRTNNVLLFKSISVPLDKSFIKNIFLEIPLRKNFDSIVVILQDRTVFVVEKNLLRQFSFLPVCSATMTQCLFYSSFYGIITSLNFLSFALFDFLFFPLNFYKFVFKPNLFLVLKWSWDFAFNSEDQLEINRKFNI